MRKVIFLIATIAWMAVIFSFSAKPAPESAQMSLSVGMKVAQVVVPDFEELPVEAQMAYAERLDHPIRKCAHATEYGILGFLLAGAIVDRKKPGEAVDWRRQGVKCLIALGIAVAYAASDEIHQLFVPGRAGMLTDVLIDSGGAVIGVVIGAFCLLCRKKR